MTIVITTGVLVRGVLHTWGNYMRLVDYVLDGKIYIALDDRIYFEYVTIFNSEMFGFEKKYIQYLLKFIEENAIFVTPEKLKIDSVRPSVLKFVEVAKSVEADALVVNNLGRFDFAKSIIPVLSPKGVLDNLL